MTYYATTVNQNEMGIPFLFKWQNSFQKDRQLNVYAKSILRTLGSFMNNSGDNCFPSYTTIAREAGVCKQTAIKYIKSAVKLGYIKITKTKSKTNNEWYCNKYIPVIPINSNSDGSNAPLNPNKKDPSGKFSLNTGGGSSLPPDEKKSLKTKSDSASVGGVVYEVDNLVDEIDSNYPKEKNKINNIPNGILFTKNQKNEIEKKSEKSESKKAIRLPENWHPDEEYIQWVMKKYNPSKDFLLTEIQLFANYWQSKGGSGAKKVCWFRTWKNWWIRAIEKGYSNAKTNNKKSGWGEDVDTVYRGVEEQNAARFHNEIQHAPRKDPTFDEIFN